MQTLKPYMINWSQRSQTTFTSGMDGVKISCICLYMNVMCGFITSLEVRTKTPIYFSTFFFFNALFFHVCRQRFFVFRAQNNNKHDLYLYNGYTYVVFPQSMGFFCCCCCSHYNIYVASSGLIDNTAVPEQKIYFRGFSS